MHQTTVTESLKRLSDYAILKEKAARITYYVEFRQEETKAFSFSGNTGKNDMYLSNFE